MTDEIDVQVLIDLDNDGWTNEGVPIGTPSNVFPRSPYTTGTRLKGRQYVTQDDIFEDVQDISKQGLMKRLVKMGKDVDGDYAEDIHMSFDDYYSEYQRRLTDPENLIPKSVDNDFGSVYIPPSFTYINFIQNGLGRNSKSYTGTLSTPPRGVIGLDYNNNGVHGLYAENGFIDGSNQYSKAENSAAFVSTPDNVNSLQFKLGHDGTSVQTYIAQSFVLSQGGYVTQFRYRLGPRTGTTTGCSVGIYADNAGKPNTGGVALYNVNLSAGAMVQNSLNSVNFPTQDYLAPGTYWAVIRSNANAVGNYDTVLHSNVNSVTTGVMKWQGTSSFLNWTGGGGNYDADIAVTVVAAAITWSGFPVTAGNTYTFGYQMYVSTATPLTVYSRVYGDSVLLTTPNYGRVYLAGNDHAFSGAGTYHVQLTFTVPVGVTQIALDTHSTANSHYLELTDFFLIEGSVTLPTDRIYDEQTVYGENQFALLLEPDTAYVLSFWARSADGIDLLDGFVGTAEIGGTDTTVENIHSLSITSDWTRFDFYLVARSFLRGIGFEWITEKGGLPTGLDNVGTIEFKGFMLVAGDTATPYQVGPIAAYDDVTANVLSWNTKSGKSDFLDPLAYEGTANVLLNNVSKIYSPKNTSSPLYGYLIQNLRVEIRLGGVSIWQGWVTEYEVAAGLWEERQVTLSCQQGIYRMQEGEFTATVQTDVRIDTLVRDIVDNSGWKPTGNPYYSVLGFNALVDDNFYLNDPDNAFSRLDEGLNNLEITGLDWGRQTDVDTALKEALDSESAMLWIDRNGKLVLVNREYWVNRTPDVTYNIDSLPYMTAAEYQYGQDMVNRVQVSLNSKRQTLDAPVWKTYRAVYVKPNDNRYLEINPQYQEGRQRTVVKFTLEGAVKTGYYKDPGMTYLDTDDADSADMDKVILELFPDVGNRYRLRINNTGLKGLWIDVELRGDYLETADETIYVFEDTDAIEQTGAIHYEQIDSPLISRESEAASMAQFRILRAAYPDGEFRSLEFTINKFMLTELLELLETELGHIISITEGQTGEVSSPHAVIAEEFSVNGGVYVVRFILARAQKETYFELDTSELLNTTVNLVEDISNIVPIDGSGIAGVLEWPYEGLETILYWDLQGHWTGELLLNPAPNQYKIYSQTRGADYWPEFTAASVDTSPSKNLYAEWSDLNLSNTVADEETNTAVNVAEHEIRLTASLAGINWRLLYGAQMLGLSKEGDTVFNALCRLPVLPNTLYRAYARNQIFIGTPTYSMRVHKQFDTLATGLATDTLGVNFNEVQFNSSDANAVAFSFWGVNGSVSGIFTHPALLQMSNITHPSMNLDTTVTHKYTVYMKIDPKQAAHSFTLNVYGVDGTVIATQTQTVGYDLVKFEVTIPTGANSKTIWASLKAANVTFQYLHKVYIYAYGVTLSSVASYTELLTPTNPSPIYL